MLFRVFPVPNILREILCTPLVIFYLGVCRLHSLVRSFVRSFVGAVIHSFISTIIKKNKKISQFSRGRVGGTKGNPNSSVDCENQNFYFSTMSFSVPIWEILFSDEKF